MQIYVMDGDYEVLKTIEAVINTHSQSQGKYFTNAKALVEAVRRQPPDAVWMDFDTPSGPVAAKTIKSERPEAKILMMTKDQTQMTALFELSLSGYLVKPIQKQKAEEQMFRLEHPLLAKMIPLPRGTET